MVLQQCLSPRGHIPFHPDSMLDSHLFFLVDRRLDSDSL